MSALPAHELDAAIDAALGKLPSRGRPGLPPQAVRELRVEDLAHLQGQSQDLGPVAKIREGHHAMARLLAEGRKVIEVSALTGYTPQRVTQMQHDPSFKELVEFYRGQKDAKYLDIHGRLAMVGTTALQHLQEKLEDEEAAADLSVGELNEIVKVTLDRAGFGPTSKREIKVTDHTTGALIDRIKSELESRGRVGTVQDLIEAEAHEVPRLADATVDAELSLCAGSSD